MDSAELMAMASAVIGCRVKLLMTHVSILTSKTPCVAMYERARKR